MKRSSYAAYMCGLGLCGLYAAALFCMAFAEGDAGVQATYLILLAVITAGLIGLVLFHRARRRWAAVLSGAPAALLVLATAAVQLQPHLKR